MLAAETINKTMSVYPTDDSRLTVDGKFCRGMGGTL